MTIELTTPQASALRELLGTRLGNRSTEIRHTDSPRVRQELRDVREALREIAHLLEAVPA